MDVSQVTGQNYGILWVLSSFVCFVCNNVVLGMFVPVQAKKTPHHIWKWRNLANSLVHSIISGSWAIWCFWVDPNMRKDLINSYSTPAHGVVSLSVGYFIYDFLDMAFNDYKRSADLLVHHTLVISCLGLTVCTRYYQGFALVALLVELNSIFLHLRQLMLMRGVQKSSLLYHINGVLNLTTFFLFRVLTMGGMLHWLLAHQVDLTNFAFGLGVFSMAVILFMNFQLFMRVLKSDYSQGSLQRRAFHGRPGEESLSALVDGDGKTVCGKLRTVEESGKNRSPLIGGGKTSAPAFDGDSVFALMSGNDLKME